MSLEPGWAIVSHVLDTRPLLLQPRAGSPAVAEAQGSSRPWGGCRWLLWQLSSGCAAALLSFGAFNPGWPETSSLASWFPGSPWAELTLCRGFWPGDGAWGPKAGWGLRQLCGCPLGLAVRRVAVRSPAKLQTQGLGGQVDLTEDALQRLGLLTPAWTCGTAVASSGQQRWLCNCLFLGHNHKCRTALGHSGIGHTGVWLHAGALAKSS